MGDEFPKTKIHNNHKNHKNHKSLDPLTTFLPSLFLVGFKPLLHPLRPPKVRLGRTRLPTTPLFTKFLGENLALLAVVPVGHENPLEVGNPNPLLKAPGKNAGEKGSSTKFC